MISQARTRLTPAVGAHDHTQGRPDAPITLVEYGDYACAFCTETYPKVERLRKEMGETLRFVYRHFPVTSPARSRRAAEAAEAAAAQDRFWEMHNLLSRDSGAHLTEDRLFELARSLDLNMDTFGSALQQNRHAARIEQDLESSRQSDVRDSPTFFVNGARFEEPLRAENLLAFAQSGPQER